jgi:DNA modification methylase
VSVEIRVGDAFERLRELPDASVQCCVTSPPYFGLRDYGAIGQIGLEPSPGEYVTALVRVFAEVRRVLADDGTLWLNLGDSYGTGGSGQNFYDPEGQRAGGGRTSIIGGMGHAKQAGVRGFHKQLLMIPARVALALQADEWYLRSDIIWAKPNPMPESVMDRPTKSHEYLFLLAKSERYYYDAEAAAEDCISAGESRGGGLKVSASNEQYPAGSAKQNLDRYGVTPLTRNRRTVWTVATQPYSGAHFATFPPALIEPCILAGSREGDTVLDPFGGAGTTGLVADRLKRNAILIELNPVYAELARNRIADDAGMFAEVVSSPRAVAKPNPDLFGVG